MEEKNQQDEKEPAGNNYQDWGDAPDVSVFYGRSREIALLGHWVMEERCNVISVLGIAGVGKTGLSLKLGKGGIGKTDLSVKVARGLSDQFEFAIWRKLINAPSLDDILLDIIKFFSKQQETVLPDSLEEKVARLCHYLKSHRCLILLDNLEALLKEGEYPPGKFREGYESYEYLLEKISEINHQSCVIFTSREKPKIIDRLEVKTKKVKSLYLKGLEDEDGRKIFLEAGCFVEPAQEETQWEELIQFYNGNPLALELSAKHIREVYFGNISQFLKEGKPIFHDLKELIDWHFDRLSFPEKMVMYLLAINREPISPNELREDILSPILKKQIYSILQVLKRRITVETVQRKFSLQPVLIEYMTGRLIESIDEEIGIDKPVFINHVTGRLIKDLTEDIEQDKILWLNTLVLVKAFSKDFIRAAQRRLIAQPLVESLIFTLGSQSAVEDKLSQLLETLRQEENRKLGYAAGNILNLLCEMRSDLSKFDFSGLTVWHAYLQGYNFQGINFTNADLSKSLFAQTFSSVQSVAISPDEQIFAAADTNGEIRLWRLADGQHLSTLTGHTNWVRALVFHPDSSLLASASDDHTVKLWHLEGQHQLHYTLEGHTNWVRAIAFDKAGSRLASASDDGTLRIWKLPDMECEQVLDAHKEGAVTVCYHPRGNLLISGGKDGSIKIWNAESGQLNHTLDAHSGAVWSLALNFDGEILASGGEDRRIKLWQLTSGDCICINILEGHKDRVNTVSFPTANTPGKQILISGSEDTSLKIWDTSTGLCTDTMLSHTHAVLSTDISNSGQLLLSGGDDQTVKLWAIAKGKGKSLRTLLGHTNLVWKVAFSPDGKLLASGNDDRTVKIWEAQSGECLHTLSGHRQWIQSVAFHANGKLLASASADHRIMLWEPRRGKHLMTLLGHNSWVVAVAFQPGLNSQLLASGSSDHTVRIWDIKSGKCKKVLKGHANWVWSVAFSPDGRRLVSSSEDKELRLWDVESGQCLRVFKGHTNGIWGVAFSPDGKTIASAGVEQEVRLWDPETGECRRVLKGHEDWVGSVAFSPDSQLVASGSSDQTIRLWEVESGKCQRILRGHDSWVWSVDFSPTAPLLASGSQDKSIKLWSLKQFECTKTLIAPRPYEHMNIYGATGFTDSQRKTLLALGAVEKEPAKTEAADIENKPEPELPTKGIFISYSHKDELWKDQLVKHLRPLESEGLLMSWNDREIRAGENWHQSIMDAIDRSQIGIVLVSANSLSSKFILEEELPVMLERHRKKQLRVIPIIVQPCVWKIVGWIKDHHLQVRPIDGKPLSSFQEYEVDAVLTELAMEIYELI